MLLIFIPGDAKMLTPELAYAHGLKYLLDSPQSRETSSGVGGVPGLLIADGTLSVERCAYHIEQQTWSARFGFTSFIGTWNDAVPTPEDLARKHPVPGQYVQLLDAQNWLIPTLRSWKDADTIRWEVQLPRVMQQSPTTGKWLVTDVIPQYKTLWDHSVEIADVIMEQLQGSNTATLDWSKLFDHAVELLAVNYRVDASVVSHLRLFEPERCSQIVNVALDMDTLRAHLKNRLSRLASSGTNSAAGAKPPTTDNRTPTRPR